jgi:osmotically-inducible protein OsmY
MNIRTSSLPLAVIVGGFLGLAIGAADTQAAVPAVASTQASQATPDADIAAKIRKAIADDQAVAAYAETVKIIVSDGLVSLKGAVKTDADKKAIGLKADAIVGEKNVMNNLLVTAE